MQQRFNIIKSASDKLQYRGLVLHNKMKVLLISDGFAEKAAAALNVNIGYLSDPDELPGLAHFCEHMLFLGTKKYPVENDYMKFISDHGGMCNATTDTYETKFTFEVAPPYFKQTLDRFAQFFVEPLFTESATEREINAVDSEHLMNVPDDLHRFYRLDEYLCNPSHPYHKFGCGNKETLLEIPKSKGVNVREALLKFYNQWYSSNIMTLAILGQQSLDELEEISEQLFGSIKNMNIEAPIFTEHPFTSDQFATITYMVPMQDINELRICFPMPEMHQYYKSDPCHYLSHLCGHEGPGSILSLLKSREWCSGLSSGAEQEFGFCTFHISADLTEDGLTHVDDVVKLVFQYINLLRKEGIQQWIFDECRRISDIHFRFKDKYSEYNYVNNLVSHMLRYPLEEVLSGPYEMSKFDPNILTTILEGFKPENTRVYVTTKKYESMCTAVEPVYGIKYRKEKYNPETLNEFKNAKFCNDLKLPIPNEFIPDNFSLYSLDHVTPHPVIILDKAQTRVWFKQDSEFLMPKLNIKVLLSTSIAYLDPLSVNLTSMFVDLLQDSLNERTYDARIAGLDWYIAVYRKQITINIEGFNDKIKILLFNVLSQIRKLKIDKKRFAMFKDNYFRQLNNLDVGQPYYQTAYYMDILLNSHSWTKDQLIQAAKYTTPENLEAFQKKLLSALHVETLIHGNCSKTLAINFSQSIEDSLNVGESLALYAQEMLKSREHKLESGVQYLYKVDHFYHDSSSVSVYYQCGMQDTESNMLLELLVHILEEPCFDTLRTAEQLGYVVFCFARRSNGTQGLAIIVQSEYSPAYVDYRIEAFIAEMKVHLELISHEELESIKEAVAIERLETAKSLIDQTDFYWTEILTQQYHFQRDAIEVAFLKNITKVQLLAFFNDKIHINGPNRSKLAIYVQSKKESVDSKDSFRAIFPVQKYKLIDDYISFKKNSGLFSLAKSHIQCQRKGITAKKQDEI